MISRRGLFRRFVQAWMIAAVGIVLPKQAKASISEGTSPSDVNACLFAPQLSGPLDTSAQRWAEGVSAGRMNDGARELERIIASARRS